MKKIFLLFFASMVYMIALPQSTVEKMQNYLNAAEKAGILNGSVLVAQKGNVIINEGIGIKDAEAKTANQPNTVFQLGSVTKQFTAAIILKLAEENKLQLSDKLDKYLPDFPNGNKITIEHLLTHTSGIYNYTRNSELVAGSDKPSTPEKIIAAFKDKPLDFEPGSKYSYSNSGYFLLGSIISKVTGKPYEQVVRERIFVPLQMTRTGFDFAHYKGADKAVGYNRIDAGSHLKAKIVDSTVSYAAGAIYSTVGDLFQWNNSVIKGELLKKASWENAFTRRLGNYGFGFSIDTVNTFRRMAHGGGIDGFASYNAIIPADGVVVTVLTNNSSGNPARIANDLVDLLYNKPVTLPAARVIRKEVKLDTTILKQYVGDYELTPQFHIVVRLENGVLMTQATGQQAFELFAEKEDAFFLKVVDAQVEFKKDASGKVNKLVLHQNGRTIEGVKK